MEGTNFIFWNWTVAIYLFVAGISAGAFAISALAHFMGEGKYGNVTRIGAYIAPFPLLFGLLCLVYDLERPYLFWKLLVTLQVHSVMSLGVWLLLLFSVLSFAHLYLWLPDGFDIVGLLRRIPEGWDRWPVVRRFKTSPLLDTMHRRNLNRFRGGIAMAGIPVALLVGIYTGVLLGALAARPFWNNPMLPMLFLVSALKAGTASICLVGSVAAGIGRLSREQVEENPFIIRSIDLFLMILSIITLLLFVFGLYAAPGSSPQAAGLIMGGEFTLLFWGMVVAVGVLLPLFLEIYERIPLFIGNRALRAHNPWVLGVATLSVLAGGFVLRYVVVYAGQAAAAFPVS